MPKDKSTSRDYKTLMTAGVSTSLRHAYVLKVNGNHMTYKVNYTSANETFGYHSANEWFDYLKAWRKEVDTPAVIKVL